MSDSHNALTFSLFLNLATLFLGEVRREHRRPSTLRDAPFVSTTGIAARADSATLVGAHTKARLALTSDRAEGVRS